jgi:putative ABC transport system permease protein
MQDLRTALRELRRAPGVATAAILTLAVGIGASTAVFSFVLGVLSAGSPAPDMERLVAVWTHNRTEAETKNLVSPRDYLEWSRRAGSFAVLSAWRNVGFNVSGVGAPVRESAQMVTAGYLSVFGWQPSRGRDFLPEDAAPGVPRTVIVSDTYWRNRLGARPDILGTSLLLDGERATIVGVLPHLPGVTSFFVPLTIEDRGPDALTRDLFVFARLRSGVSIEAARAEMDGIGVMLEREHPDTHRGWRVNVRPLQEEFVGPQARLLFALLVVIVSTVLVIGCVNIANLLLARGAARRGEWAVRLALGAGAWRIARQQLIECALLTAIGGLLSLAISQWTIRLLQSLGSVDSPWINGGLNGRVLALTAAVAAFATFVAGLLPALASSKADLVDGIKATARSSVAASRKTTRVLVGSQVALAVTLLVIAGLATRTLMALERLDPGFDIDDVLTASVTLPESVSPAASAQWSARALDEIARLPGVTTAGATTRLPLAGSRWNPNRGVVIEGQTAGTADEGRWAVEYAVTPGFLEALRVPLVAGRTFQNGDGEGAPLVVLVSETMARRFWGDRSPLGARLRQGREPEGVWRMVVGVVSDVRNDDADQPPLPYLYMPLAQQPSRTYTFAIRTAGDPLSLAEPLRQALAQFDRNQALYDVRTMRNVWERDLQETRLLIQVIAVLAMVALGLAGMGVWGVTAQAAGQRTREIGVRMALGASASQVGLLVARQGLTPVVVGLFLGLAAGLGVAQLMRGILFNVSPTDVVTVGATLIMLFAVGLAATLGPALRAARLDPLAALRIE